jgi:hypothetical protein
LTPITWAAWIDGTTQVGRSGVESAIWVADDFLSQVANHTQIDRSFTFVVKTVGVFVKKIKATHAENVFYEITLKNALYLDQ